LLIDYELIYSPLKESLRRNFKKLVHVNCAMIFNALKDGNPIFEDYKAINVRSFKDLLT